MISTILFSITGILLILCYLSALRWRPFYIHLLFSSISDTFAWFFFIGALICENNHWQVILRLLILLGFNLITAPIASHTLAHTADLNHEGEDI